MDTLGSALARLPAAAGGARPAWTLDLAWALAAGPQLGPEARCLGLRGGTLVLEAGEAAQARIKGVGGEIRRALNRMLGEGKVQRLQFVKSSGAPGASGTPPAVQGQDSRRTDGNR